ncbi:MAG: Nif3-like dinuclear metal center hexameric protein, partial [Clostridia bacterium]|nr:Nif3-like dinuclear metal center hexameric protein [Clostridia bacterium]
TGAGGRDEELLEYARLNKIDCIVGGESKLSIALAAKDYGIALIDVGHYDSEILCVKIFAQWLEEYKDLLRESASDINPYKSAKEIL